MTTSRAFGNSGEDIALLYLESQNLKLIKRNFNSRFGEIDLIMQDIDTTVFIEVRYRKQGIDNAIESISYTKQKHLIQAAKYYLSKISYDIPCRFDAVAIAGENQIKWLKNVIIL